MKDEPIDFIPFVVLLGLVVSMCMNIIIPMYRNSFTLKDDEIYDKTVNLQKGEIYYPNNYHGQEGYSYSEMVLYLANQSYFMPTPRVFDIGGEYLAIQAKAEEMKDPNHSFTAAATQDYVPENLDTIIMCRDKLSKWCAAYSLRYGQDGYNLRFTVRFTPGTVEGESDDCYAVYVIGKKTDGDGDTRNVYLKCLLDGKIEEKPNVAVLTS